MSTHSIVTVRQEETDHNFLVVDADPGQMAEDLRTAIGGLAEPSPVDMGDLAASFCTAMRVDYGAGVIRMLPAWHPRRLYDMRVRWHFVVTRPLRGLRVEVKRVVREDKKRVPVDVWEGSFADFEKQVKTITKNIKDAER